MGEVKLTEANLPLFFGLFKSACGLFVCRIHAHARVEMRAETTRNGMLPVAVPDPGLVTAAAVDPLTEETGAFLATKTLPRVWDPNPPQWTNSADPASVQMAGVSHL